MSRRKSDDYISDTLNNILKESREYKAYELGWAYGWFQFYVYLTKDFGEDDTNKIFQGVFTGSENNCAYFRELVKLYKEDNSKVDDLLDKYFDSKKN